MDTADLVVWLVTLPLAAGLVIDGIATSTPAATAAGVVLALVLCVPQLWLEIRDRDRRL